METPNIISKQQFTVGSSFVEMGAPKSRYAIVSLHEVVEAKALSPQTSAQKIELTALVRALQLGKENKLSIFTDSKCGFHILMLPFGKKEEC